MRQEGHDIEQDRHLRVAIHEEAYNQALVNLITVHILPYSLFEWPEWYALLHTVNRMAVDMLLQGLRALGDELTSFWPPINRAVTELPAPQFEIKRWGRRE